MTSFNIEFDILFSPIKDNQLPYLYSNNIIENDYITIGDENYNTKNSSYLYIGNIDTVNFELKNVLRDSLDNSSIESKSNSISENEKEIDSSNNSEINEQKGLFMTEKHSNQLTKKKREDIK